MNETQDVIEREIRIAARPETVFPFFTDPEKMVRWKGIGATLDPQPGGVYRIQISESVVVEGKYLEIVPNERVVFAWGWQQGIEERPPESSTVEISLVADGPDTIVYLRHEGLPAALRHEHAVGWDMFLPRLLAAVQGGEGATRG